MAAWATNAQVTQSMFTSTPAPQGTKGRTRASTAPHRSILLTLTSLSSLPVTMMLELSSAKATALTSSWCALTCRVACRDTRQGCQSWADLWQGEGFWKANVQPCLANMTPEHLSQRQTVPGMASMQRGPKH